MRLRVGIDAMGSDGGPEQVVAGVRLASETVGGAVERFVLAGDEAVLNIAFAKPGKFYGWHCEYDSQGFLVITIKSKPSSIKNYTIMIQLL